MKSRKSISRNGITHELNRILAQCIRTNYREHMLSKLAERYQKKTAKK